MVLIFIRKSDNEITYQVIEKVYAWRQKKKTKDGKQYQYSNYMVFFDKDILDLLQVKTHVYLYKEQIDEQTRICLTGVEPENVDYKKLRVNVQRGNKQQRELDTNPGWDWKRFFVVPRKFFDVNDDSVVRFDVDFYHHDRFTGLVPRVTMTVE